MNIKSGRVISGKYRGKKIPLREEQSIRPTTDRVKETIFNILQHSYADNMRGVVLDLFAGSGSLGIECLSRGAESVVFVDKNPQAMADIKKFVKELPSHTNGSRQPFIDYIVSNVANLNPSKLPANISLVFLDPPYESTLVIDSLNLLLQSNRLQDDCIFVIESSKDLQICALCLKQTKIIGKTIIKIYQLKR
jgi:16S rRNA (guanine(966)-N(2))-methyltransferase RsmD